MVKTYSVMPDLGMKAKNFVLPSVDGELIALEDIPKNKPLLVMFICNHCPFVLHIIEPLVEIAKKIQSQGVYVVAINSNDIEAYPEDGPDKMVIFAKKYQFSFPYVFDESQHVAREYQAACTPDFFLFDKEQKLFYRGQLDDSRPGNQSPTDGKDLLQAVQDLLAAKKPPTQQKASIGCNIKWK